LLLLIVAMFTRLEKGILKSSDAHSLNRHIKRSVRSFFDWKTLVDAAVSVAGKSKASWSATWSWHEVIAPVRQRLSKTVC
jgi:hypothetical protein